MMNTKITLTSNGNYSPNITFDLGNKYENVGDTLEFVVPAIYKKPTNHYYLAFKMKRMETILLPVENYVFHITRTITDRPGTYEMIFLITENEVVNGDIDEAVKVYVSNVMKGVVKDNFLTDPVTEEVTDKNIELYYNKLDALYDDLNQRVETNYYKGDYYKPAVDEYGYLTWSIKEGYASEIPTSQNITGPQGPQGGYYSPSVEDSVVNWEPSQENLPTVEPTDLKPAIKNATDDYLNENLKNEVSAAVDAKFKWTWNPETKTLFIETEELETVPEYVGEVKF